MGLFAVSAIAREIDGSRDHSVTWRPARLARQASAVPQAPPPTTPMCVKVLTPPSSRSQRIERPARPGAEIERIDLAEPQPFQACPRDHRAIVSAKFYGRRDEPGAMRSSQCLEASAQIDVGRDAASDDQRWRWAECK